MTKQIEKTEQAKDVDVINDGKNDLKSLQAHLFTAIKKVVGGGMKAPEAKALSGLAQAVINSYKVDLEMKKAKQNQK